MADLSKEKLRRLTTVPDDFLAKIPRAESAIYDQVVELIGRLQVRNGSYVVNAKNLRIASDISSMLREILLASDYTTYVTVFAAEFDQQASINDKLFSKAFPEYTASELGAQVVNIAKRDAIDLLLNRASDTDFIAPLRDTIEQAVINGAGYQETVKAIRTFIEGNDDVDGALLRYSSQQAHDTFAIADRSYTSIVSEEIGATWFKYSGDEIDTTRPFCAARDNQFYYYKEVESWGDLSPWSGQIPGTNSATIYSYAGGFNCRHSIMPVSLFAVPLDVVRRNIDSGNYEPTDKEIELLGL